MTDTISPDTLAKEIEQLAASHSHLATLLAAFGPLFVQKAEWLATVQPASLPVPIDADRFSLGVPVGEQQPLFIHDDPWQNAGLAVARAIAKGFTDFHADMQALEASFSAGGHHGIVEILREDREEGVAIEAVCNTLGITATTLAIFLPQLRSYILAKKAASYNKELVAHKWSKGYCPFCGSLPHLAIVKENGVRWLQCPDCSHEWQFPRLVCPACGQEDAEDASTIFIEGQPEDSVFTCSGCKSYLPTAKRSTAFKQLPADLITLSLIHLDIIAQKKGYHPMVTTEWNSGLGDLQENLE